MRRTPRKWRQRTLEEAGAILNEYDRSGLTQERFAAEHGISFSTLRFWLRRRANTAGRVPSRRFVPVRLSIFDPAAEPILEIVLGSRRRVRVPASFDPDVLAAMLRAIEPSC